MLRAGSAGRDAGPASVVSNGVKQGTMTRSTQGDQRQLDRVFSDMPQLLKIAANVVGLLPRYGQDVHIARVALARDSPLDSDDERSLRLLLVVAFGGEPT